MDNRTALLVTYTIPRTPSPSWSCSGRRDNPSVSFLACYVPLAKACRFPIALSACLSQIRRARILVGYLYDEYHVNYLANQDNLPCLDWLNIQKLLFLDLNTRDMP